MTDVPSSPSQRFQSAGLITHAEALKRLRAAVTPVAEMERIALEKAGGRILARAAVAGHPVPFHTNSAVDGYAFAFAEVADGVTQPWPVHGRAAAGHPFRGERPAGRVIRILTGAVMPDGLDTVAMQEDCRASANGLSVTLPAGLKRGANVRKAGEDVATGTTLFEAGHVLRPQDLAALSSIGTGEVDVFKRLRVAIVSTGDEVRRPGSGPLETGEVYDANAPMLTAFAEAAGADVVNLGILKDDPALVEAALKQASERFDVVLTSGGASQGEEDHMAAALGRLGSRHFWQIAIKPGRPMMFGDVGRTLVIGLPGNPVAVFVCALMYVHPLLRRLSGGDWPEPRRYKLPAAFHFDKRKTGRREFWRGILVETPSGLAAGKYARDGSGLISGLRAADGLIDIPEDAADIAEGDLVDFIPFSEFGIAPNTG